jgi:YVTN family beta-propeller protein
VGRVGRASIAIVAALAAGCATHAPSAIAPRLPRGAGLVFLYLEPLPREAAGLRAEIASIAATSADGTAHDLHLEASSLDASGEPRQHLLALGPLPAGAYHGIEVTLRSASLAVTPEALALPVPSVPASSEVPFAVAEGHATILRLRLDVGAAIARDQPFETRLTGSQTSSTEIAPNAIGIATVPAFSGLVVFHKLSGEVFDVLLTAAGPSGAAYDRERSRCYVACAGPDVVEAFDLVRGVRDQTLPLIPGDDPAGLTVSPDGRTIVVANHGSNTVSVLDAPALTERSRVAVGLEPVAVVLAVDQRRAFVLQNGGNGIAVVDLARGVVVATIATEPEPRFAALSRDGRRLLVIHDDSSWLSVVDVATSRVAERVYVGPAATAIAVDPRTDRVYLARSHTGTIEAYDPRAMLPIDTIETPGDVTFLTIDRETDQLLAAIPAAHAVLGLRLVGGEVTSTVELGAAPVWIDVAANGRGGP